MKKTKKNYSIKVGLIPAAGKSQRIKQTNLIKSMIPIKNRPILEYVVRHMKKLGVKHIYIIVGYQKEKIKKYFGSGKKWKLKISYLTQKNLNKGLGYAVGLAERYIHEPFIIILGDDITVTPSLKNLVEQFFKYNVILVEAVVPEKNKKVLKNTCCVKIRKNGLIKKITEKPLSPSSTYRGCGIYVAQPEVFQYIKKTPITKKRGLDFTKTIDMIAQENKALAVRLDGININVNTDEDLIKAAQILKNRTKKYENK